MAGIASGTIAVEDPKFRCAHFHCGRLCRKESRDCWNALSGKGVGPRTQVVLCFRKEQWQGEGGLAMRVGI